MTTKNSNTIQYSSNKLEPKTSKVFSLPKKQAIKTVKMYGKIIQANNLLTIILN